MLGTWLARLLGAYVALYIGALAVLAAAGIFDGRSVAVTTIALGAAFVAGGALAAVALRALERVAMAARAISGGDLARRAGVARGSGVEDVASAFNEMARTVERRIADVSQERSRLSAALNSTADAVFALDRDGQIVFANRPAEELFGRTSEEMEGHPFGWVVPDQQVLDATRAARLEGRQASCIIERPNRRYLELVMTPILEGGAWSALVVCHDLTEVKRTELVRRDFVANVSHELRTPLAAIKSVLETLADGALDDRQTAEAFLGRADAEVDRLVRMVEELLTLSRMESGELAMSREPVDLGDVLREVVARLREQAERHELTLRLDVATPLPTVLGDADRLERAVVNLVRNGIDFTPGGGTVSVRAGARDGAVVIEVADTGVGIAREDLPRVFERFYRADRARKGEGTGLGLAIVKHTVEAHGGSVGVESDEGRGATFRLTIPIAGPGDGASDGRST